MNLILVFGKVQFLITDIASHQIAPQYAGTVQQAVMHPAYPDDGGSKKQHRNHGNGTVFQKEFSHPLLSIHFPSPGQRSVFLFRHLPYHVSRRAIPAATGFRFHRGFLNNEFPPQSLLRRQPW